MARPINIDPNKNYPVHIYIEEVRKRLELELMMLDDFQNYILKHHKTIPGFLIRNERNNRKENVKLYKKRRSIMLYSASERIYSFQNSIKRIESGECLPWT